MVTELTKSPPPDQTKKNDWRNVLLCCGHPAVLYSEEITIVR